MLSKSPSSLYMTIYQDHLSNFEGAGYRAVWEPDPGPNEPVQVGDVGFFLSSGFFVRIFNIFYEKGTAINSNGVPSGFTPADGKFKKTRCAVSLPQFMKSESVKAVETKGKLGLKSKVVQAGAEIEFSCIYSTGAALLIKEPTDKVCAEYTDKLKDILAQNHKSWYQFFTKEFGDHPINDMILVTDYVLASDWNIIVFSNSSEVGQASFHLSDSFDTVSAGLSRWRKSGVEKSAFVRQGPSEDQIKKWKKPAGDQQHKSGREQLPEIRRDNKDKAQKNNNDQPMQRTNKGRPPEKSGKEQSVPRTDTVKPPQRNKEQPRQSKDTQLTGGNKPSQEIRRNNQNKLVKQTTSQNPQLTKKIAQGHLSRTTDKDHSPPLRPGKERKGEESGRVQKTDQIQPPKGNSQKSGKDQLLQKFSTLQTARQERPGPSTVREQSVRTANQEKQRETGQVDTRHKSEPIKNQCLFLQGWNVQKRKIIPGLGGELVVPFPN